MGNMKALQRRKFIALNAYIKNLEKSNTSNLTAHLTDVEQQQQKKANSLRKSRHQEIIKLRAEINKIEAKKTKKSMR